MRPARQKQDLYAFSKQKVDKWLREYDRYNKLETRFGANNEVLVPKEYTDETAVTLIQHLVTSKKKPSKSELPDSE